MMGVVAITTIINGFVMRSDNLIPHKPAKNDPVVCKHIILDSFLHDKLDTVRGEVDLHGVHF
jgi:hypothetical protein